MKITKFMSQSSWLALLPLFLTIASGANENCADCKPSPKLESGALFLGQLSESLSHQACQTTLPSPVAAASVPRGAVFANEGRTQFYIPLENPKRDLKEGDILLYVPGPSPEEQAKSKYAVLGGVSHAAIVYRNDNGEIAHLDSPKFLSGPDFNDRSFHVLRPKKNPEIQSKMKALLRNVQIASAGDYSYSFNFGAKITDPAKQIQYKSSFDKGVCPKDEFYCSGLVSTLMVSSGFRLPRPSTGADLIKNLDRYIVDRQHAHPSMTRKDVIEQVLNEVVFTQDLLQASGLSEREAQEAIQTRKLPLMLRVRYFFLLKLFSLEPGSARNTLFESNSSILSLNSQVILPRDILNESLLPDGEWDYVGTYVGRECEDRGKSGPENQRFAASR